MMPTRSFLSKMAVLFAFAVAMAYLEAAVVVYLRQIFGDEIIPVLKTDIHSQLILVECGREAATIVMLAAVGFIASKKLYDGFTVFLFLFGIWDIFYYVWLYVLIGWPSSLLTWDVLFLLPTVWVGPVIAPVLISLSLILAAWLVLHRLANNRLVSFTRLDWLGFGIAGLIIVVAFVWNHHVAQIQTEIQLRFPWVIFLAGEMLASVLFIRRFWLTKQLQGTSMKL